MSTRASISMGWLLESLASDGSHCNQPLQCACSLVKSFASHPVQLHTWPKTIRDRVGGSSDGCEPGGFLNRARRDAQAEN